MKSFIELHQDGEPRIINLDWVEEVRPRGECCTVYFALNIVGKIDQDHMEVDESYNKVKGMIWSRI